MEPTNSNKNVKSIVQISIDIFKNISKRAIDEFKIINALDSYVESYEKRYGFIKVLGMPKPISINDIYTTVQTISTSYRFKEVSIESLERSFRDRVHYHESERKSGISIANKHQFLNILGPPGSGKSTFLKRLGLEAFKKSHKIDEEYFKHSCIPVLVELKRFRNEKIDLKEIIKKEFDIAGFPESTLFIERALKSGMLLILLDGLDEVPKKLISETIEHIKDFTDKYKSNRFVTSCRTAFYKNYLSDFVDVEIADFDNNQISVFIKNWFSLDADIHSNISERFTKLLFSHKNKSSLELARTPLLLTFLCLTFDDSQRFPANRSSLYRRALMILMEKWAAEKRIHNEDIYQDLSPDIEIEMLAEIAAKFYEQDKLLFYQEEVQKGIQTFIENTLNIKNISVSRILEAIEIQQGLLVQRAPEIFSFSHLTIQEYLTAHFFNTPKRISLLIDKYILDPRWREVFLLLAGMNSSDDFLSLVQADLNKFASTDEVINNAIRWINKLIPVEITDAETSLYKRIFLVSLLLRYKRYNSNTWFSNETRLEESAVTILRLIQPESFDPLELRETAYRKDIIRFVKIISQWGVSTSNLDLTIEKIKNYRPPQPFSKLLEGGRQKYRKEMLNMAYDFLQMPENLRNLRKNKCRTLENYLNGIQLLIECKNSSLRVTRIKWDDICNSILVSDE
jgi:hypothetical protein